MWEGVTVVRKCDSPQDVCHLVERCNGEKKIGEVKQLTGSLTFTREV